MTKVRKRLEIEDNSELVAVAISEQNRTTLITPHARYEFFDGRLCKTPERVDNYDREVKKELDFIANRATTPMNNIVFQETYTIQIYGKGSKIKFS